MNKKDNNMSYMLSGIMFGQKGLEEFDKFLDEYGDKTDEELYEEVSRIQDQVPVELKKKHLNNLEQLAKMQGFVNDETREKINKIKELINVDTVSSWGRRRINSQFFFGGASLLLWFLLVVILFRGCCRFPFFGRPY